MSAEAIYHHLSRRRTTAPARPRLIRKILIDSLYAFPFKCERFGADSQILAE
jgi:hypothetical protein